MVPEVLDGKKFICLAISEAQAGSDVMGLQTTAVKSEDGKEWIINGRSFSYGMKPPSFLLRKNNRQ